MTIAVEFAAFRRSLGIPVQSGLQLARTVSAGDAKTFNGEPVALVVLLPERMRRTATHYLTPSFRDCFRLNPLLEWGQGRGEN